MKRLILIFLLLLPFAVLSQERAVKKGFVVNENSPLADVHIKNANTKQYSITNKKGIFMLPFQEGDTLYFSHIGFKKLKLIITSFDAREDILEVAMETKTNELKPVEITAYPNITAVSLGIIDKEPEKLTQNERRLQTASDFKLTDLLTGKIALDPIINAISGRTKRIKRDIELDRKTANIAFLELHYEDYVMKKLQCSEEDVGKFFYFLIEKEELQPLIDSEAHDKLPFFICDKWIDFKAEQ